jgi:hypothetical protein
MKDGVAYADQRERQQFQPLTHPGEGGAEPHHATKPPKPAAGLAIVGHRGASQMPPLTIRRSAIGEQYEQSSRRDDGQIGQRSAACGGGKNNNSTTQA